MMSNDGLSSLASSSMRGFIQDPNINNNILIPNPNNPNPNIRNNPSNSTPSTTNKRKRNMPGNPGKTSDPDAEVISLSPKSLMATNRFICEICNKGFQRDQNLQLHRRGHNLPWKLKQRNKLEVIRKKVYICPEKSCVHHDPSRALGDLTGIKKHFSRKHGEKKWKCEKCSKKYAVQSDWKAHSKICGTREYKCDCGTLFSRKDSFITHRAFCDALAEDTARFTSSVPSANLNFRHDLMNSTTTPGIISTNLHNQLAGNNPQFSSVFGGLDPTHGHHHQLNLEGQKSRLPLWLDNNPNANNAFLAPSSSNLPESLMPNMMNLSAQNQWFNRGGGQESSFGGGNASSSSTMMKEEEVNNKGNNNLVDSLNSMYYQNPHHHQPQQTSASTPTAQMSATALLQKAAQMGSTRSGNNNNNNPSIFGQNGFGLMSSSTFSNLASNSFNILNQNKNSQNDQNVLISGLMSSNNTDQTLSAASTMTMDHHASRNATDPSLLMMMQPNNTPNQSRKTNGVNDAEGSLTRDFLGVGGNNNRPFFSQNDLAKFELFNKNQ
ncbi:hypothetical protein Leryth_000674 [Lithospermum erythrorhizon]|nr:hypothetical protein Leryth_000674 [Lithospermum erythrorhizon]